MNAVGKKFVVAQIFHFVMFFFFYSLALFSDDFEKYEKDLKSLSEDIRYDGVDALGDLGDPRAIASLKTMIQDSSMMVRHGAAEALAQIGGLEVEAFFRDLTDKDSVEYRRIGVLGLGEVGCSQENLERILTLRKDSSWEVRWASYFSLGQLGDVSIKDVICREGNDDSNEQVRQISERACRKVEEKTRWFQDLGEVNRNINSQNEDTLVLFMIRSSKLSRTLYEQVLTQNEFVKLSRKFFCVRLNPLNHMDLVKKYEIKGVPTLLLLSPEGEVLKRIEGLIEPQTLFSELKEGSVGVREKISKNDNWREANQLLDEEKFSDAVKLLERLIKDGFQNPYLNLYLGYAYGKLGRHREAVEILKDDLIKNPSFAQRDKVLYCLALSELALNQMDEARTHIGELIQKFQDRSTGKAALVIQKKMKERNE